MPTLEKLESTAPTATPNSGEVILYFAEESGDVVLKAKKSDGSTVTVLG